MAVPTFVAGGAGIVVTTSPANAGVTCQVGDILILHVLVDSSSDLHFLSSVTGAETLDGTDGFLEQVVFSAAFPGSVAKHNLYIGRATSTTPSIGVDEGGGGDCYARLYAFRGVNAGLRQSDVIENGAYGTTGVESGSTAAITDVAVVTQGQDRLAVQFVGVSDDNAVAAFTGMSGGTWAEAVAEFASATGTDACLQLQTASKASAGTIDGGSQTMAAADAWGVIGFALIPAVTEAWEQKSFRFRNDDGTESTATWLAAADADVTLAIGSLFRLRFLIQNDASLSLKCEPRLQWRKNGGSWADVGGNAQLADVRCKDTANLSTGFPTTQQLGAGTFKAGKVEDALSNAGATAGDVSATNETEYEWSLELSNGLGGLSNGDTVDFRLVTWAQTPFSTYTQTPTITLGTAGVAVAAVLAGVGSRAAVLTVQKPLAAVVAGTSGGGKALGVAKPLVAALAGVGLSGGTRSLGVGKPLAASLPGAGSVAALVGVTKQLAAAVGGSGAVTAVVGVAKQLVAALPGQGSASGDLSVTAGGVAHALSAVLAGAGALVAPLGALKPLVASVGGSGAVTAPLTLSKYVVARLDSVGAIAAPLQVAKQLLGSLGGQGATSGSVQQLAKPLSASVSGSGSLTSSVTNTKLVSATLSGVSGAVSALTNSKPVAAVLSSSGVTSAQLAVQKNLNAVLDGAVTVMASLTVGLGDLAPKLRRMMGVGE